MASVYPRGFSIHATNLIKTFLFTCTTGYLISRILFVVADDMDKTLRGILIAVILAVILYLVYQFSTGYLPVGKLSGMKPAPIAPDTGQNAPDAGDSCGRGVIRVAATIFWHEPAQARDYDALVLKKNNDPAAWAGGMDTDMRLWLVGKAGTMGLLGEPVIILERRGEWIKVAAAWQRTNLNVSGYPGWVPASHIVSSNVYNDDLKNLAHVVVADRTAGIFKNLELTDLPAEAGYMTRLPLLEEREQTVAVRLPGGDTGYLSRSRVKKAGDLYFSQAGIVEEAKKFIDLRYVWAGTSSYGFDCSGFTMRLYQSQGISIPRDADEQAMEGAAVARADLTPGDLVFFAAKGGLGQIHHVGMYIGSGMMIHSPNSNSAVSILALDSGTYGEEYWGARRYAN